MASTLNRRFVRVRFGEGSREFTYHYDGDDPPRAGERVIVRTRYGGNAIVEVVDPHAPIMKATSPCRRAGGAR